MQDLTVAQAAKQLGVHITWIHKLISDGTLEAYKLDPEKVSSPYVIKRASFDRYKNARSEKQR